MKERLVTLALAAGAFALFWILMFPQPRTARNAPPPLTTGQDNEGYGALSRWLSVGDVPMTQLHQRFDHLGDRNISAQATGNLLVITLPFALVAHPDEIAAVRGWVGRGNTLLVLAALDDTPMWSAATTDFVPDLQTLTGIAFKAKSRGRRLLSTLPKHDIAISASGGIGLLEAVTHLAATSPLPSTQWEAKTVDTAPVLELARRTDTMDPVLWAKPAGNGAMIISAYASVLSNGVIGSADNARLFANIVGWSLKPGGRVIFDDAHQGAIDEYDAAKFFADPRVHHTLWWLIALWLAWVMVAQPLRACDPYGAGLSESAMLRVTATFFAGVLRPVASAQWLLDEFFERMRRRHGLLHSALPPWEWLGSHAGVSSAALAQLRDYYARTQAGQRVSLVQLQRIISQISGQTS